MITLVLILQRMHASDKTVGDIIAQETTFPILLVPNKYTIFTMIYSVLKKTFTLYPTQQHKKYDVY